MTSNRRISRAWLLPCLWLLAGCAVNPVTGERHLQFYDEEWEKEIGAGYYEPMRQQQGGDFVLDPELVEYVQSVGDRLAGYARRQDTLDFEFHVINDSTPNAWALPGGKISINRGLLTQLQSEAELAAVLGHEIVHADAAHSARQQSAGMLTQVGAVAGMILIGSQADSSAGKAAAVLVPSLGAQLLTQKYSRDAELEADEYGMRYMAESGYDPNGAVELQETFVRLSEGRNQNWMTGLFASHPPSRERVEQNQQTARALPAGGEQGRNRYQQKTAYLRRVEPAYAAYDRALKAAADDDLTTARKELDTALAIEPREAVFHAMDGDLKRLAGNATAALDAYNTSVNLNPGYFYNRLRRGESRLAAGQRAPARDDLSQSVNLLTTALGHYLLGNLDRDAGNIAAARKHYEKASASDSEVGRKAQQELARLEHGENPARYLSTAPYADNSGEIYCLLGNQSQVELMEIRVTASLVDDQGTRRTLSRTLYSTLGGGEQVSMRMDERTTNPSTIRSRMSCNVDSAKAAQSQPPRS